MRIQKQLKHCALVALLCFSIQTCFADNIAVGRYLTVPVRAQQNQQHLLQQHIQIRFPQNILTIQQAIQFILQFSGYHLVEVDQMNHLASDMLRQPLSEVDRTFGPMTLEQGLTTLAGDVFTLLIDPVHRLVSYQVKQPYQSLYQHDTSGRPKQLQRGHDDSQY